MTVKFFMDVHIPRAVTIALRAAAIDVLTAQEDGSAMLSDADLLLRATYLGRVMVSQDADMLREGRELLRQEIGFCGIVYGRQIDLTIGQFVESLSLIATATDAKEWQGQIAYIPFR